MCKKLMTLTNVIVGKKLVRQPFFIFFYWFFVLLGFYSLYTRSLIYVLRTGSIKGAPLFIKAINLTNYWKRTYANLNLQTNLIDNPQFNQKAKQRFSLSVNHLKLSCIIHIFTASLGNILRNKKAPIRRSHQRCTERKSVLRNFIKFTGKHLYQSLFLNKVAGLKEFCEACKNTFLQNNIGGCF